MKATSCSHLLCLAGALLTAEPVLAEDKTVYGYIERVIVSRMAFAMEAKLDTGADTSSLDARIVKRFRKNGERWVRFRVTNPATGEKAILEKPLVRDVRIKRHSSEPSVRPVVRIPVCLGRQYRDVQFSLVNRNNFNYPVLLGRLALSHHAMIDPSREFLNEPTCDEFSALKETPRENENN